MHTTYWINPERTRAFKICGHDLTKVVFRRTQLNQSIETEIMVLEQKAGARDVMNIMRDNIECTEEDFKEVLTQIAAYSSMLSVNGEVTSRTLQIHVA